MFVSPAIHGSYEFGRIAYHQYVNIYAVHQLYDSWTIVLRPVLVVQVVSSHSEVVSVWQYWTRMIFFVFFNIEKKKGAYLDSFGKDEKRYKD